MVGSHEIFLTLPYPRKLSVNNLWKIGKRGIYLNPRAKKYRLDVLFLFKKTGMKGFGLAPVGIKIKMIPPDNKTHDIDNLLKVLLDSLQYAQIYANDSQVIRLYIEKLPPQKNGAIEVLIKSLA